MVSSIMKEFKLILLTKSYVASKIILFDRNFISYHDNNIIEITS